MKALELSGVVLLYEDYVEGFSSFIQGKRVEVLSEFSDDDAVGLIREALDNGTNVSVLVPGDITVFTPVQWLIDRFPEESVVIPGVGSINAASSAIKKTLTLPSYTRSVVIFSPRSLKKHFGITSLSGLLDPRDAAVIMMNTWGVEKLKEELKAVYGDDVPVAVFRRLSLPGERVFFGTIKDWPDDMGSDKLDLIIAGHFLKGEFDRGWWKKGSEKG